MTYRTFDTEAQQDIINHVELMRDVLSLEQTNYR